MHPSMDALASSAVPAGSSTTDSNQHHRIIMGDEEIRVIWVDLLLPPAQSHPINTYVRSQASMDSDAPPQRKPSRIISVSKQQKASVDLCATQHQRDERRDDGYGRLLARRMEEARAGGREGTRTCSAARRSTSSAACRSTCSAAGRARLLAPPPAARRLAPPLRSSVWVDLLLPPAQAHPISSYVRRPSQAGLSPSRNHDRKPSA
jgi:hypothetical protein